MIFALLITALNRSSNQQVKRGIYQDLESTFDFDGLQSVSSKAEFGDTMRAVAVSSKRFFRKLCLCVLTVHRFFRKLCLCVLTLHRASSLSCILVGASSENHTLYMIYSMRK